MKKDEGMTIVTAAPASRRAGRVGRGVLFSSTAALLALAASACSAGSSPTPGSPGAPSAGASSADAPTAAQEPKVSLASSDSAVSYLRPVKLVVAGGSFTSVQVSSKSGDEELDGAVTGDGTAWVSELPPKPSSDYQAVATIKAANGQLKTKSVSFTVAKVPANKRVAFTVTPDDGATVGIGQPIVVRFLTPITEKAAFEKAMTVRATTPSGDSVVGSWHWLNSQQVDWRPQSFFQPGTTVKLNMKIAGVKASDTRFGRQDYSETFTIGASHITRVDASSHRVQVFRDGKLVDTWPTGTGRHGLETYSGTYIVLGKSQVVQMDSCSARVTCDKKNPDYYNEKEYWATRITASGTFLHAASWDGLLGRANTSHGCIHLSDSDAKDFYNHAVAGDVVIVKNTGRGPQQRIDTQDPGLYDWNLSWSQWVAGSALH
jgi:lipoprotein-anchoring transpeptidase ErfK/SrfK